MATTEQIIELGTITTRNDAGQHFTSFAKHWEALEAEGLVAIDRPTHAATGIAYSHEYWTLEVTKAGQELVDGNVDLFVVED